MNLKGETIELENLISDIKLIEDPKLRRFARIVMLGVLRFVEAIPDVTAPYFEVD